MDYKVVVTADAEEDLEHNIKYLLLEKKSMQAAQNVLRDFEATKEKKIISETGRFILLRYSCGG